MRDEDQQTAIVVGREGAGASDKRRSYRVLVDGKRVGQLRRGEHAVFALPPGEHEVWVAIDWCRSKKQAVALAPGERAAFSCEGAKTAWEAAWRSLFRRTDYLQLQRAEYSERA